jgi:hypothetical protein
LPWYAPTVLDHVHSLVHCSRDLDGTGLRKVALRHSLLNHARHPSVRGAPPPAERAQVRRHGSGSRTGGYRGFQPCGCIPYSYFADAQLCEWHLSQNRLRRAGELDEAEKIMGVIFLIVQGRDVAHVSEEETLEQQTSVTRRHQIRPSQSGGAHRHGNQPVWFCSGKEEFRCLRRWLILGSLSA